MENRVMSIARHVTRAGLCGAVLALGVAACRQGETNGARNGDSAAGGGVANASTSTGDDIARVEKIAMRPFSGSVQDASSGRQAFLDYNCYGCHGGLAGGAMGPSLRDDEWKFGGTDEQILSSIADGRPAGMPAWKGVVPADQLRHLVVYIRSLRSREEPTWFFAPGDTSTKAAFLAQGTAP
jgi:mono/diheme cytochrome c family protein